ncbi:MAG: DUF4982 domain-containing protein, partial [Treponema sp.]|nr:DUF4982 domain-containing protein [Treponema sp.]
MQSINLENWKFSMDGDLADMYKDPWSPGFDDTQWEDVVVPHDWAVAFPFSKKWSSGTGYLPGGSGWYRTVFDLPAGLPGNYRRVFACFDGVYKNSRVWCNGYYLGMRPSGYTGFQYDITHCLRSGSNVIAVKVSHEDFADSRWYTGSGMYRKAFIAVYDNISINEFNIKVESEYAENRGVINVTGEIFWNDEKTNSVIVEASLDNGAFIGKAQISAGPAAGNADVKANQKTVPFEIKISLDNPKLWSPQSPYLYSLSLEVYNSAGGEIISVTRPVRIGIRTIRFNADKGFFLNGTAMKIKGVCVHHDAGCLGAAVWPDVWRRRLEKLKGMGCNAIRTSHNPHNPELYDLCDEMGFLVMDEAFDEWEGCKNKWSAGHNVYPPVHQGYAMDFPQWHERDLADMVIRDRNHPCIIIWSIGNEIDYPNDPYAHPLFSEMTGNNDANKPQRERIYNPDKPNMERLSQIAPHLAAIVKKHDSSRPVILASAFPELSSRLGLFDALDIVGYNYKEQFYEADHRRFPNLPILGSENSHSMAAWKAVMQNDYISGQFLWTGIDYLGEARGWPIRGSGAGLLDIAGNEKIAYYRRKALWSDVPFVYIVTRPLPSEAAQPEVQPRDLFRSWDYLAGENVEIICYGNLPELRLLCNGKDLGCGTRREEYGYTSWVIPFEKGKLEIRGCGTGKAEASDCLESTLAPVQLKLHVWKQADPDTKTDCAG